MNVKIKNGVRNVVVDKSERATLERARDICHELMNQWTDRDSQLAEKAKTWLVEVLNCIPKAEQPAKHVASNATVQ
jgi:hypothetical protein